MSLSPCGVLKGEVIIVPIQSSCHLCLAEGIAQSALLSETGAREVERDENNNINIVDNNAFPLLSSLAETVFSSKFLVPSTCCLLHAATCLLNPYALCSNKKSRDNPALTIISMNFLEQT